MDLTISPCESTDRARSTRAATGQTIDVRGRRHLHVVPESVVADGEAGAPVAEADDLTTSERGFASVSYLPTFMPAEEEQDGEVELGGPVGEEDLTSPVAAVLPVPSL